MPATRLTASPEQVALAVRAVLAGKQLTTAATCSDLDPDELGDAVDAYHAAGAAALEDRAAGRWQQARVRPANQDAAERTLATVIGPRLDDLVEGGAAAGWWFMRKPPGWRIRLLDAGTDQIAELLAELTATGTIVAWRPAIYEPEAAAFGGGAGMGIAHSLFCADSSGVLRYVRRDDPPLGRRELSVLLISAMLAASGLDWFERGDVFTRVAAMRPAPPPGVNTEARLAAQLRALLSVPVEERSPLFTRGGPASGDAPWRDAFDDAGRRFADAASSGALRRGLRAVLAHTVIFHWNRLGLPAAAQASLARAAASACLPEN